MRRVVATRNKNPELYKRHAKKYRIKLKFETLSAYANGKLECGCCRTKEIEFLTIDHIDNDGAKERKESRMLGGSQFYGWLKRLGYPKRNYQILCLNCNRAKYDYGKCPHEKTKIQD